jgi:ATP-binding cassette, subfamily C (CFTR/MRP), member 1
MRNVKLLGLAAVVENQTQALRTTEIALFRAFRGVDIGRVIAQNSASIFAPFATFFLYYLRAKGSGTSLDLATVFSVLTILRTIENPLNAVIYGSVQVASTLSCFDRIQDYLFSEARNDNRLSLNDVYDADDYWTEESRGADAVPMRRMSVTRSPADEAISLKNCSFGWKQEETPVVKDIDLSLRIGSVTMIIGPVGCGKSTFLKGLLSETPMSSGFVYVRNNSISFADQDPWVQNGTIKDAIYGASAIPADRMWYDDVVACCGLAEDIKNFPKGDETIVGSKGISLSGGQKQRLALARAIFSRAEILLLDDVFSGLDRETEEHIFRKVFARNGLLRRMNTTVILVTHAVRRLPYADLIVSMNSEGRISETGNYIALANSDGYVHALDVNVHQQQEEWNIDEAPEPKMQSKSTATDEVDLQETEDILRRNGEWTTWKDWFSSCGHFSSLMAFLSSLVWIIFTNTPGILVRFFATDGRLQSNSQSTLFITLFGASTFFTAAALLSACWFVFMAMAPASSKYYHIDLLRTVLAAPLSFFTRTDIGSITNRFSQDLNLVDIELPVTYVDLSLSFVSTIVGIALMAASGAGYFAATIPVLLGVMYVIQKYYLRTSRQLRILDLEMKAPLYTQFGETASGLATIRAFDWADKFYERNAFLLDESQRPFYLLMCVQRWLNLVLELVVAGLVLVLLVIVVQTRATIDPGLVGVGLLSAVSLSNSITNLVLTWTNMETSIGAVARIRDFVRTTTSEHLPQERDEPRSKWPENGEVQFANFSASYSADSDLVLKDINLNVRLEEKIGICGRSGSGKSSALASLLHLLEFRHGSISIDGIDLATVPRETLRQKINVIPQEPWWITTETVRRNMDPWDALASSFGVGTANRDAAFISALSRCHVWHIIRDKGGLDAIMTSDFLSHGQRQLFCLARAMLRQSKLVVLDEVSANVDVKTDDLMQGIIRDHFADCTIITVAHRLNTIDDGDRVVVLKQGRVLEVGAPGVLLRTERSAFKELHDI